MGGEGIHNPADLAPVLDELDDIDAAIEVNRLLLLIIQAGVDEIAVDTAAIIAALIVIDNEIEIIDGIVDAILVHTTLIEAVTSALPTLTETGTTM